MSFPEDLPLTNITEPVDADILCGRDVFVQRHVGNLNYRQLVNMNKAIYIACKKEDKKKISKSIVNAIREKGGRFLEKNKDDGTWYDIGDKRAQQKTSQALRENQPKLKAKLFNNTSNAISDSTGSDTMSAPATTLSTTISNSTNTAESSDNVALNESVVSSTPDTVNGTAGPANLSATTLHIDGQNYEVSISDHDWRQKEWPHTARRNQYIGGYQADTKPQVDSHISDEMENALLMQKLSLTSISPPTDELLNSANETYAILPTQNYNRQYEIQHDFAISSPAPNGLNFSNYNISMMTIDSMPQQHYQVTQQPLQPPYESQYMHPGRDRPPTPSRSSSSLSTGSLNDSGEPALSAQMPPSLESAYPSASNTRQVDRRRLFARMKIRRPPSGRSDTVSNRSVGTDGMPDIHMVDSQFSLFSNLSTANRQPGGSMPLESRRSLMSGLSRISDSMSVFSDLSRKIGNVSTRSIPMSEISGIEEGYQEDLEASFDLDQKPAATRYS